MKKTITRFIGCMCAGVIIAAPFSGLSVMAANDGIGHITYDESAQRVTVSGMFDNYANKNVVMTVLRWNDGLEYDLSDLTKENAKSKIYAVKQSRTGATGDYEMSFTLNSSDNADGYKVFVSGSTMQEGEYITEEYILEKIGTKLLSGELSGDDIGEFKTSLGIADVSEKNYNAVALKMIEDKTRYDSIKELAGKSAAVVEINGSESIIDMLKRYKDILNIANALDQFDYFVESQGNIIDAMEAETYTYAEEISAKFRELVEQAATGQQINMTVSYSHETHEIEVLGAGQGANKRVVMTILKPLSESESYSLSDLNIDNVKSVVFAVKQGKTAQDGTFSFKVGVPEKPMGGSYEIKISCEGMNGPESMRTKSLYISTEEQRISAVNAVNKATILTIGDAIKHKALNLDYSANIYTKNKTLVNEYMIRIRDAKGGFADADIYEVCNAFYAAEIAAGAKNKNLTETELLETGNLLGICTETEFKDNAAAIISLMQDNVPDDINSIDKVKTLYKESLAIAEINNAGRESISAIIQKYAVTLGISGESKYQTYIANPTSQSTWNVQLAHKNFRTTEAFRTAFGNAVQSVVSPGNGGSGGGGSGSGTGGNGRGSGGVVPGILTDGIKSNEIKLESKFSDMNDFVWAEEAVSYLESRGIVNGVEDGKYKPAESVTREQFIKMVVLLLGIYDENAECNFEDCDKDDWSYRYIASAKNAGITSGITEALFGKKDNITREQAAVFIYRAISDKLSAVYSEEKFNDDNDISDYAKEAVSALKDAEIINGMGDGRFAPLDKLNRAEAAVIIYRLAKIEGNG